MTVLQRITEEKMMLNIKRILVASDMSENSMLAMTRAARICKYFALPELEIVNVQDTGFADMLAQILDGTDEKSEALVIQKISKDFEPVRKQITEKYGIATSLKILFGRASVEIAQYANKNNVSLVIVGASNSAIFLGNTPDRLLHGSQVPLLIVRQPPENPYQNVLVPVDFSKNSLLAAKFAMTLMLPASKKTFLHAFDVPHEGLMRYANVSSELLSKFRIQARKKAEQDMNDLIAGLDSENRVSQVVQYGSPTQVIEDYVNTNNPDLIVMGKQGRSQLGNLLLGSTARHTVNATVCDILMVPLWPESTQSE